MTATNMCSNFGGFRPYPPFVKLLKPLPLPTLTALRGSPNVGQQLRKRSYLLKCIFKKVQPKSIYSGHFVSDNLSVA